MYAIFINIWDEVKSWSIFSMLHWNIKAFIFVWNSSLRPWSVFQKMKTKRSIKKQFKQTIQTIKYGESGSIGSKWAFFFSFIFQFSFFTFNKIYIAKYIKIIIISKYMFVTSQQTRRKLKILCSRIWLGRKFSFSLLILLFIRQKKKNT